MFLWYFHIFGLQIDPSASLRTCSECPKMSQACPGRSSANTPHVTSRRATPAGSRFRIWVTVGRPHGLGRRICRCREFYVWLHLRRGDWLVTTCDHGNGAYMLPVCVCLYTYVYVYIYICLCVCISIPTYGYPKKYIYIHIKCFSRWYTWYSSTNSQVSNCSIYFGVALYMCVYVCAHTHITHIYIVLQQMNIDMENPWFPRQNYLQVGCPFCQYLCQFTGG